MNWFLFPKIDTRVIYNKYLFYPFISTQYHPIQQQMRYLLRQKSAQSADHFCIMFMMDK